MRSSTRTSLLRASAILSTYILLASASQCGDPLGQISLSTSSTYLGYDKIANVVILVDAAHAATFQLKACEATDTQRIDITIQEADLGTRNYLGFAGVANPQAEEYMELAAVTQGAGEYYSTLQREVNGTGTVSTVWSYDWTTGRLSPNYADYALPVDTVIVSAVSHVEGVTIQYLLYNPLFPGDDPQLTWHQHPAQAGDQCGSSALTGPVGCPTGLECFTSRGSSISTCMVPKTGELGDLCGDAFTEPVLCGTGLACASSGSSAPKCMSFDQSSCLSTSHTNGLLQQCNQHYGGCKDGFVCIVDNPYYSQCFTLGPDSAVPCP